MTLQKLWNIDPGYFRLKHAVKTIVAILLTLWLMRYEKMPFQLMAGIVCGFSMQGVVEKTGVSRIIQIVALNFVYLLTFVLGLLVRDSVNATAIMLIILGFVVNYCRRFNLQTSMAPMMAWTLCFFATTLPFTSTLDVWAHSYAIVIALLVSAVVNALIFPENYQLLFIINSNRLFRALSQSLYDLRQQLLRGTDVQNQKKKFHSEPFVNSIETLSRLLESNQAMEENQSFTKKHPRISDILLQQYALVHAYQMMLDTYRVFGTELLTSEERLVLSDLYSQFEHVFASLHMRRDYTVISKNPFVSLASMSKKLMLTPSSDSIIVLLNMKLGFNLFNQHIKRLGSNQERASL